MFGVWRRASVSVSGGCDHEICDEQRKAVIWIVLNKDIQKRDNLVLLQTFAERWQAYYLRISLT